MPSSQAVKCDHRNTNIGIANSKQADIEIAILKAQHTQAQRKELPKSPKPNQTKNEMKQK